MTGEHFGAQILSLPCSPPVCSTAAGLQPFSSGQQIRSHLCQQRLMYNRSRSEVVDVKGLVPTEYMFWKAGTISEHAEELRACKYCPRGLAGCKHQTYLVSG